jgi:hypothetical protein
MTVYIYIYSSYLFYEFCTRVLWLGPCLYYDVMYAPYTLKLCSKCTIFSVSIKAVTDGTVLLFNLFFVHTLPTLWHHGCCHHLCNVFKSWDPPCAIVNVALSSRRRINIYTVAYLLLCWLWWCDGQCSNKSLCKAFVISSLQIHWALQVLFDVCTVTIIKLISGQLMEHTRLCRQLKVTMFPVCDMHELKVNIFKKVMLHYQTQ